MTSGTSRRKAGLDLETGSSIQSLSVAAQAPLAVPVKTRRCATKEAESTGLPPPSASTGELLSSGQTNYSRLLANLPSRILALDVETSGLVAKYDQITEIAACVMEDGKVEGEPFCSRIRLRPSTKISLEVLALQFGAFRSDGDGWRDIGRSLKKMYDAPEPKTVVGDFFNWTILEDARDLPVVAFNASFDYGFYREMFGAFTTIAHGSILSPTWICAMEVFKRAFPDAKKANLNAACIALRIAAREEEQGHSALQDAILAGRVYFESRQRIAEFAGSKA